MFNRSDYILILLAMNLYVNQRVANFRTVGTAILTRNFQYFCLKFIFNINVLTEILVVYQLNNDGLCSARK